MAFSDFDSFQGGAMLVANNVLSEVLTDGSLELGSETGNGIVTHVQVSDSSGRTKGQLDGRMRTIIKYVGATGSGSASNFVGLYCLSSQEDLSSTGSCYSLAWHFRDDLTIEDLRLNKHTTGLDVAGTNLASSTFSKGSGDTFTLQLDWISSLSATIGGTYLKAYTGTATDFSDLSSVMTWVDYDSPLTTSVAEGVMHRYQASSTGFQRSMFFDQNTLFSLA